MPSEVYSFVEKSDNFYSVIDENVKNPVLVNVVAKQSWHDFLVFLVQIGGMVGNILARLYQFVIVKVCLILRPSLLCI